MVPSGLGEFSPLQQECSPGANPEISTMLPIHSLRKKMGLTVPGIQSQLMTMISVPEPRVIWCRE